MTVAIQPAGNSASIQHYKDTVEKLVQISQYEELIGADLASLQKVSKNGSTAMWDTMQSASAASSTPE